MARILESLSADAQVWTTEYADGVFYVGGFFTSISGTNGNFSRNRLAAIDTSGNILPWDPDAGTASVLDLKIHDGKAYIAGDFSGIGGDPSQFDFAIFTTAGTGINTGFKIPFSGNPGGTGVNKIAIDAANNNFYIGGSFTGVTGTSNQKILAYDIDTLTMLPGFTGVNVDGQVRAMTVFNDTLYVGQEGTTFDGSNGSFQRSGVAAYDLDTAEVKSWAPPLARYGLSRICAVTGDGDTLYVGGEIDSYIGSSVSQTGIVALDPNTAASKEIDYMVEASGFNCEITDLEVLGSNLYASGRFTGIGGGDSDYSGMASVNKTTGLVDTSFTTNLNALANGFSINSAGSQLMVGGTFTTVDGASALRVAAFVLASVAPPTSSPGGRVAPDYTLNPDFHKEEFDQALYINDTTGRTKPESIFPKNAADISPAQKTNPRYTQPDSFLDNVKNRYKI